MTSPCIFRFLNITILTQFSAVPTFQKKWFSLFYHSIDTLIDLVGLVLPCCHNWLVNQRLHAPGMLGRFPQSFREFGLFCVIKAWLTRSTVWTWDQLLFSGLLIPLNLPEEDSTASLYMEESFDELVCGRTVLQKADCCNESNTLSGP